MVRAALHHFLRQENDFAPGELDTLLAGGTSDLDEGRALAGTVVFDEIRAASKARRGSSS